jgi:hypothetical protein
MVKNMKYYIMQNAKCFYLIFDLSEFSLFFLKDGSNNKDMTHAFVNSKMSDNEAVRVLFHNLNTSKNIIEDVHNLRKLIQLLTSI